MLEHLAYKLQGIKLHAKVQVGLWKGLLNWDDSELVADQPGDATDKALRVTEARLKKQPDDVMAVRAQRLGPSTSPPAASSPPPAASNPPPASSGPPPAASPTARVTEKRGRNRGLPWTTEIVEQLFNFVLLNKAHLDKSTKTWTKMQNSLFKQPTLVEFVAKHSDNYWPCSEFESVRPLKEKYKKVLETVKRNGKRKAGTQDQMLEYPQLDKMVRKIVEEQDHRQWQVDHDQQILSSQRNGERNGEMNGEEGDGEDEDMLID
ncbi:hypothetical protein B484DRAFT_462595 [Ochromonadaceae sp. CCMP2298]|nr:hypothetical protein B484DRAFT_462595 [Ochromonadaceae sp. CCMP2298]